MGCELHQCLPRLGFHLQVLYIPNEALGFSSWHLRDKIDYEPQ